MYRNYCLVLVALLLALSACGGGGGTTTFGNGLTPLDFDVTTDADSSVQADDVIGYAVEKVNPMYSEIEAAVPDGFKLASVLLFQPETADNGGFSGDFTVRTTNHAVSSFSYGKMIVKYKEDEKDGRVVLVRDGIAAATDGSAASFRFRLDYLGVVVLLEPTGSQFQVAAFADLATAQVNTDVNFWALSRNGEPPIDYRWDFGDGTTAVGAEVTHSYPLIADYNVSLTATDAAGNVAPVASTPISIVGNPVLLSTVDVVVTDNGDGSFDYSATLNGGTPPFEYEWDLDGDGEIDSREGSHIIWSPQSNLYRGSLVVTDQTGASAETEYVTDARGIVNHVKTAAGILYFSDPHHSYAPEVVNYEVEVLGANSFDTITVDFGDGTTDTYVGPVDHAFAAPGVYVFTVTVTRNVAGFGDISKQSEPLVVTLDPRPAPRIDSVTPSRAPVGTEITLVGNFFFLPEVDDEVLLNDVPMPVVTWEPGEIVVTVPAGAKDGDITIHKALGNLVSNPIPFDVAPTPPGQPGTGQL